MTATTFASTRAVTGTATLPRVNLLPPEIAEQRQLRRVKAGLGIGVLGCAAVVGLLYTTAHASVGSAQGELDTATTQRTTVQADVAKLSNVTLTFAQVAQREAMLTSLMGDEVTWSSFMNDLALTVPDHVWLTNVGITQSAANPTPAAAGGTLADPGIGSVTFSGVALSHDDVAVWLEALAKQRGYANPYFTNSTQADLYGHTVYNFSSSVVVTPAAYSGRYAKKASS